MKANIVWIIITVLIIGSITAFVFWPKTLFISPLASFNPDFTPKLQQKISGFPKLDQTLAKSAVGVSAKYLVFNLDTGRVYLASGSADKIAPASLTKLLTSQVALDLGYPTQLLTATKTSVDKVPTVLGLRAGEQLQLTDLLRAAIATSANDAAATIAEGVASQNGLNLTDFIALMNQKATMLKMENSHFATPDGLDDPTQYVTLNDLGILVENTVKNYPDIMAAALSDRQDLAADKTHGFYYISNWNGLLGVYPGVYGLKIAYTENAGHSTIVLSERNKTRIAVIVSGATTMYNRDAFAASLLDQAFAVEKIPAANVTEWQIKQHYKVWNDLILKTRADQAAKNKK